MKQIRPIQRAFRLATGLCHLANEWRDTASYTVGGALLVAQAVQGDPRAPLYALLAVSGREAVRSVSWERTNAFAVAGRLATRTDPLLFRNAAGIVFSGCSLIFFLTSPDVPVDLLGYVSESLTGALGFFAYRFCQRGGIERGLRGVYFGPTGMWDWPRKSGGHGPTQTDKVRHSFKRSMDSIGKRWGGLSPQPWLPSARRLNQTAAHPR